MDREWGGGSGRDMREGRSLGGKGPVINYGEKGFKMVVGGGGGGGWGSEIFSPIKRGSRIKKTCIFCAHYFPIIVIVIFFFLYMKSTYSRSNVILVKQLEIRWLPYLSCTCQSK